MHTIHEAHYQKCPDNNDDVNLALLQVRSTSIGTGLPCLATLLFNRPMRVLLPQMNREQINFNADDKHYDTLKTCQDKYIRGSDAW